jgi:16S rRNA processing protein RimM
LREITSRDMAAPMVGHEVWVDRNRLPALEAGTFYWCDIIGLKVVTAADDFIGRVVSVMPTGSNDVYVVKNGQDEHLIPALATVVSEIDLDARTMRVELPAGL